MKQRTVIFFLIIFLMTLLSGKALSQTDTMYLETKPSVNIMMSGGIITDFAGAGEIVDLTVLYNKHVFGFGFSSEGTGKVITYKGGWLLNILVPVETSYAADLRQMLNLHYGQRLSNNFSLTGGIAWVMRHARSAINGHTDAIILFSGGDYHADLVDNENDYAALPITLQGYFRIGSWCGLELHTQVVLSRYDLWFNAGLSFGFGNFPGKE